MLKKSFYIVLLIVTLVSLLAFSPASPVYAGTLTVNTLTDENDGSCVDADCSLRDAVQVAVSGDIIDFSVTGVITLTSQITINKNLTITGPGADQLSISGDDLYRIFYVNGSTVTVSMSGLTIEKGYVVDGLGAGVGSYNITSLMLDQMVIKDNVVDTSAGYPRGGGVAVDTGSLTITNSTISGNSADWAGGGIAIMGSASLNMTNVIVDDNHVVGGPFGEKGGGGISIETNAGFVSVLTDVTISDNTSTDLGGGLYIYEHEISLVNGIVTGNVASSDGGGVYAYGSTLDDISNSVFSLNDTQGYGGALFLYNSTTDIIGSTFSGNKATGSPFSVGGAIFNLGSSGIGELNISNSTFSGNTASNGNGGAIYNQASGSDSAYIATTTINNSTIVGNTAKEAYSGGGLFAGTASGSEISTITLSNSIVYGNTLVSGSSGENCAKNNNATIVTDDHNLFENLANDCVAGSSDITDSIALSAIVDVLADNGGSTQTRALLADSVAMDAGNDATCTTTDQRGITRPQDGDTDGTSTCDIGAYEYNSFVKTLKSMGSQDGWILESSETSAVGGTMDKTATLLYVGDDAQDKQYRSYLSFNTVGVPDDAVITSVQLKIKVQGFIGGNMFTPTKTHGNLLMDIRQPHFGANADLVVADFQSGVSRNSVGVLSSAPVVGWYTVTLKNTAFEYVNLLGTTQFRLRFTKDDNDDMNNDYIKIFSGNAPTASRPQLIVEYDRP